jgi:hypothetical protein
MAVFDYRAAFPQNRFNMMQTVVLEDTGEKYVSFRLEYDKK